MNLQMIFGNNVNKKIFYYCVKSFAGFVLSTIIAVCHW